MSRTLFENKMERFPSLPQEATHSINCVGKAALRDSPSYFKTERGLRKDASLKGDVVDLLVNGTHLIVLDEGTGFECCWVQVVVVGKDYGKTKLFVHKDNVRKLTFTANSAVQKYDEKTGGNPRVPPIVDWTALESNISHFDSHDSKYKVCVEMSEYEATGGDDINNRLILACKRGLKIILRDNGKKHDDELIDDYIDKLKNKEVYQFCTAEEYFVDIRPNTFLKVLVTLPRKYLLALDTDVNTSVVEGVVTSAKWDVLENVVFKSSYKTKSLKNDIEKVAAVLDGYAKQIEKFNGTVVNYNASIEAENVRSLFSPLDLLMRENSVVPNPFDSDEIIELGWDATLTLIYVSLMRESGSTIIFHKGVEKLSDTVPYDNQTTQGYLWNLTEISKIDTSKLTWTDFLFAYTLPNPPQVNPSQKKGGPNKHDNIGNISDNTESMSKKMSASYNDSPVKVYTDKLLEDRDLGNLDTKFKLYQDRVGSSDFVGDFTASCEGLQKTLENINTVDDAFEAVLDKVNIADLISQCMSHITPDLSRVQDLASDVQSALQSSDTSSLGSGIGINDIPDVEIDYNEFKSKIPDSSIADLDALADIDINELGIANISFDELGMNQIPVEKLNLEDIKIKEIPGVDADEYFEINAVENSILFKKTGTKVGGSLKSYTFKDLKISSVSFDDLNMSGLSFDKFKNINIRDYIEFDSLNNKFVFPKTGSTVDVDDSVDTEQLQESDDWSEFSFDSFKISSTSVDDFGFKDFKLGDIEDIELSDSIELNPFNNNITIVKTGFSVDTGLSNLVFVDVPNIFESGGIGELTLGELNLGSISIGDIGFSALDMSQLGLEGLTFGSLGISGYDIGQLSSKLKDIGVSGASEVLDNLGADKIPGLDSISDKAKSIGIDDSLSMDLDKALKKLDKLKDFPDNPAVGADLFNQSKPKMPPSLAIAFPDSLPTQDIMAPMGDAIEGALTTLLSEIFVAMVKNVLLNLSDACNDANGEGQQFGKENMNTMLEDSIPDASPGQASTPEAIDAIMDSFTDPADPMSTPIATTPADKATRRGEVISMLDDVSVLLTPVEICTLINGTARRKTVSIVRNFLKTSYPNMNFDKKSKVIKFFRMFGSLIDPSICRVIESAPPITPTYVVGDILCQPAASEADEIRESLLKNKEDQITPDQIKLQLKRARQRKANAAKILADFVNDGPLSDGFSPPPIFCQKGESGSNTPNTDINSAKSSQRQKGLVDLSHDSIDYMTDKAVDLMYDPVYMSFSSDVTSYPDAFIKAPDSSEYFEVASDSGLAINYYGSKEIADQSDTDGDGKVKIAKTVGKVMPSLKSTLLSIETTEDVFGSITTPEDLSTVNDYSFGGYGMSLKLPVDVVDLTSILSSVEGQEGSEAIEGAVAELAGATSNTSWDFVYVEPLYNRENLDLTTATIGGNAYLSETSGLDKKVVFNVETNQQVEPTLAATLSQEKYNYASASSENIHLRKHAFASLLMSRVSALVGSSLDKTPFYNASKELYDEINKDILAYITNLISESPFFKSIKLEPRGGPADTPEVIKPVLNYLKLDPEPSLEQRLEGCDPHLLDLKDKKKELKDSMKKERCVDLSAPTDGTSAPEMSDQEKEMMKLCIKTIIRTYMVDYYMRGIFTNSVFSRDSEPSELYLSSVYDFIIKDLELYDEPNMAVVNDVLTPISPSGTYKDDFLAAAYEVSDIYENSDEAAVGPFESSELGRQAVSAFIKEQYIDVYNSMRDRTNSLMISDIESRFVLEYLPIVIGPTYNSGYEKASPRYYSTILGNLNKAVKWSNGQSVNWNNGNLYLEPYYYVEFHDAEPSWWSEDGVSSKLRFGVDPAKASEWNYRGVTNKAGMLSLVELAKSVDREVVDFTKPTEGLVKSVSKGIRLMYAPLVDNRMEATIQSLSVPSDNKVWKKMWSTFSAANKTIGGLDFSSVDTELIAMEKCLVHFELEKMQPPAPDSNSQTYVYNFDAIATLPVLDARELLDKDSLLRELEEEFPNSVADRYSLLTNHEDFRAVVDFIFPIRTYKTIMELYCQQTTSYDIAISGAMSSTKDELRRLFFAINSRGDYKQKDPSMDEIGGAAGLDKMMKNEFGLLDMPASSNSWNYNLPLGWGKSVKGLGFEAVAKATGEAILKIFKKHVEKTDPNISIAHKLAMVSKLANVNIPTSAWSFMLLPANVFPPLPGPPIGPLGFAYHAFGLGMWGRPEGSGSDEDEDTKLAEAGFKTSLRCLPELDYDLMYEVVSHEQSIEAVRGALAEFSIDVSLY